MKKTNRAIVLSTALLAAGVANAAIIADVGGDYVDATAAPAGWNYLNSTAASGGTEAAMTANTGVGDVGNIGFTGGDNSVVLGSHTSTEYEIFADGYDGDGSAARPSGNEGVVGTDLLLHPGSEAANAFTIVRYTIQAGDLADGTYATIAGSFRDLAGRIDRGGPSESITAEIFHNTTSLFSVTGGTTAQGTPSHLLQATGTFNVNATVALGDTISFVIGNNATNAGDESALTGTINVIPEPATLGLITAFGAGILFIRRRFMI